MFFLLHGQKDIDKIIDFNPPKVIVTAQIYSAAIHLSIRHWLQ